MCHLSVSKITNLRRGRVTWLSRVWQRVKKCFEFAALKNIQRQRNKIISELGWQWISDLWSSMIKGATNKFSSVFGLVESKMFARMQQSFWSVFVNQIMQIGRSLRWIGSQWRSDNAVVALDWRSAFIMTRASRQRIVNTMYFVCVWLGLTWIFGCGWTGNASALGVHIVSGCVVIGLLESAYCMCGDHFFWKTVPTINHPLTEEVFSDIQSGSFCLQFHAVSPKAVTIVRDLEELAVVDVFSGCQ